MENKIKCNECGKYFKRISTTHLLHKHEMTYEDYFKKYPNAIIEHPSISSKRKQTLENMILRYGEDDGRLKWRQYCDKQANSNSFQYKKEKYGMTYEEFDNYNKSRGSSGTRNGNYNRGYYWWWVEKYGKEVADEMNNEVSKYKDSKSLQFHIKKYGEEEGKKKYDEFCLSQSERALELILNNNGQVIYNPHSIKVIEKYGTENGYTFRHAENGGEVRILSYFVDGYDEENKTIFEYYEPVHLSSKRKDSNRIRRILEHLGEGWKVIVYWFNEKIEIHENKTNK